MPKDQFPVELKHLTPDCKIEEFPEYFECPICFEVKTEIVSCPRCTASCCQTCHLSFQKTTSKDLERETECTQCHIRVVMLKTHPFMFSVFHKLDFQCPDCVKIFNFNDYSAHKNKGLCIRSSHDSNSYHIGAQPINNAGSSLVQNLFIFERDSKNVFQFDMQTKIATKGSVDTMFFFPHNFQGVQTKDNKLYLIGGGDFNHGTEQMLRTQLINTSTWTMEMKSKLRFMRHGHSVCVVNERFMLCTGSRKETEGAQFKVEQYNIDLDLWFDAPDLIEGRHYHTSCAFKNQIVYVFAGIANSTKKYTNSIERYDIQLKLPWEKISLPNDVFKPRQGLGCAQVNDSEIIVFGGFDGKFMKDTVLFDGIRKTMKQSPHQPPNEIFAYQMPTVFEQSTNSMYTVDWQKMCVFQYSSNGWAKIKDLKNS